MSKNMLKQLRAAWKNVAEARDFVELQTMNGIIGFDTDHDQGKLCQLLVTSQTK
jgi:hypothetical protein